MSDAARILVADDDDDIRRLVSVRLRQAGFDVTAASDGNEALQMARAERPDLLLLDISMPGLDGYEVCGALARAESHPPPVIFLTARGQVDDRIRGLNAGAVDYVTKPFDTHELLARVRAALRSKDERDRLVRAATTDLLTGLLNRRGLEVRLGEAVAAAERYGHRLGVALVDIDYFKRINDEHGHGAGDVVLAGVAARLTATARSSDVVARYGGDEFTVLLGGVDEADAVRAAERLRHAVDTHAVSVMDGLSPHVTISAGVAVWEAGMTGPALLEGADHALYAAKRAGKNRVELHRRTDASAAQIARAAGAV